MIKKTLTILLVMMMSILVLQLTGLIPINIILNLLVITILFYGILLTRGLVLIERNKFSSIGYLTLVACSIPIIIAILGVFNHYYPIRFLIELYALFHKEAFQIISASCIPLAWLSMILNHDTKNNTAGLFQIISSIAVIIFGVLLLSSKSNDALIISYLTSQLSSMPITIAFIVSATCHSLILVWNSEDRFKPIGEIMDMPANTTANDLINKHIISNNNLSNENIITHIDDNNIETLTIDN